MRREGAFGFSWRAAAGALLLVGIFLAVPAANELGTRTQAGSPTRSPADAAPATGSCLKQVAPSAASLTWTVTSCTDPHTAEVTRSWPAGRQPAAGVWDACVTAAAAYLDPAATRPSMSGWIEPRVMVDSMIVHGPGPDMVPDWSWQACAVRPIVADLPPAGYRGRVAGVGQTTPPDLRSCFDQPAGIGPIGTSCSKGHLGEVVAVRQLDIYGSTQAQARDLDPTTRAQCLRIARAATGNSDPTFGRRLEVVVNLHATGLGFLVSASGAVIRRPYVSYQASCALLAPSGRLLTGSVVGIQSGALPLR